MRVRERKSVIRERERKASTCHFPNERHSNALGLMRNDLLSIEHAFTKHKCMYTYTYTTDTRTCTSISFELYAVHCTSFNLIPILIDIPMYNAMPTISFPMVQLLLTKTRMKIN